MNNDDRVQRLLALDEKRLEAAEIAMEKLVEGLKDPKTPHTARSNLIIAAFRVNGMMDPRSDSDRELEPHEMTIDEIHRRLERLRREASERALPVIDAAPVRSSGGGGVFG